MEVIRQQWRDRLLMMMKGLLVLGFDKRRSKNKERLELGLELSFL